MGKGPKRGLHHVHPRPQYVDQYHILRVPIEGDLEFVAIRNDLGSMKRLVGGYIEVVRTHLMPRIFCGCQLVMVVDEEGAIRGKPTNERASLWYPEPSRIVGDVFIIAEGPTLEGRDFVSLRPELRDWQGPGHRLPQSMRYPGDLSVENQPAR